MMVYKIIIFFSIVCSVFALSHLYEVKRQILLNIHSTKNNSPKTIELNILLTKIQVLLLAVVELQWTYQNLRLSIFFVDVIQLLKLLWCFCVEMIHYVDEISTMQMRWTVCVRSMRSWKSVFISFPIRDVTCVGIISFYSTPPHNLLFHIIQRTFRVIFAISLAQFYRGVKMTREKRKKI